MIARTDLLNDPSMLAATTHHLRVRPRPHLLALPDGRGSRRAVQRTQVGVECQPPFRPTTGSGSRP